MNEATPFEDTPASAHARMTSAFATGVTLPLTFRKEQLRLVRRFLSETETDLFTALHKDLHRHRTESLAYELMVLYRDISYFLKNLPSLARDRPISRFHGAPAVISPSAKGVILVIGPFNLPVHLLIRPLIAAVAAGNVVVLKPSEHTPACAAYVSRLTTVLDPRVCAIVQGGVDVSKELLSFSWDHIMFTGSPRIGRLVLAAAAPNLTPVTLELGGKNPAFVTASASLSQAAEAITRSRFINCGQICLSPEYVLVEDMVYDEFLAVLIDTIKLIFEADPQKCQHYARLVSTAHWQRVTSMLAATKGRVVLGGDADDEDQHYVAPTVVELNDANDPLMEEEVFGPVLSILRVKCMDEAVDLVRARPLPLALYVFGNKDIARDIVNRTRSGSAAVNDALVQIFAPGSHIGGVGQSGMGAYGGARGFEEFSHMRPVLWSSPMFACMQRSARPDVLANIGKFEAVMRLTNSAPFPGRGSVPIDEKLGRSVRTLLIASAAVGIGIAMKALLELSGAWM